MRRARPLLGTIVDITAEGDTDLSVAIEAAFASIEEVQRLMSFHDAKSDVSRINTAQAGDEISIDPHTFRVLCVARQLFEISGGLFDLTTASVLAANGFLPRPGKEAIPIDASYHDLLLLPDNRVRWHRKGWIDLGGIAKGYAVDCAIAALALCDDCNRECRGRSALFRSIAADTCALPRGTNNAGVHRIAFRRGYSNLSRIFFPHRQSRPSDRAAGRPATPSLCELER
jgi:hypothetical protein